MPRRRRYALLYFLPLIIYHILGERNDRAAGEAAARGGTGPLHDDDGGGFFAGEPPLLSHLDRVLCWSGLLRVKKKHEPQWVC